MKYPGKGASKEQWRKYFAAIRPKRGRKKTRAKNPRRVLYIIAAKSRRSKHAHRMHFDGKNFSERARVKLFSSKELAYQKALSLLRQFPLLKSYDITIQPSFR